MTEQTDRNVLTNAATPTAPSPGASVTVIIPTFNERDNVVPLLARLDSALPAGMADVLFVDDSTDDTPDVIRHAASRTSVPVGLLHRPPEERAGGLGGAVLAGIRRAGTPLVVVMDGDLQHPPEMVPHLVEAASAPAVDVVVASRYVGGGSASGLDGMTRRGVSRAAAAAARLLFPRRTAGCSDLMSGFFAVQREVVDTSRLRPDGFKILLEILTRSHRPLRVHEIPFAFAPRIAGQSKAGLAQGLVYLRHLLRLRCAGTGAQLAGFVAIGASGVIPNLAAMAVLTRAGVHYLVATALATIVAVSSNFVLTEQFLFRGRRGRSTWRRYLDYTTLAILDIALRVPLMAVLVQVARVPLLAATTLSILAVAVLRFLALDRFVYREGPARPPAVVRLLDDPIPMGGADAA